MTLKIHNDHQSEEELRAFLDSMRRPRKQKSRQQEKLRRPSWFRGASHNDDVEPEGPGNSTAAVPHDVECEGSEIVVPHYAGAHVGFEPDSTPAWARDPQHFDREEQPRRKLVAKESVPSNQEKQRREPLPVACVSNAVQDIKHRAESDTNKRVDIIPSPCSLNTLRIIIHLLLHVRASRDRQFWPLYTSAPELSKRLSLSYRLTKQAVEQVLDEMARTYFLIVADNETAWVPVTAMSKMKSDGTIMLKLNQELQPYLLHLERDYRKLHAKSLKLHTSRAVSLYWFLRGFVWLRNPRHRVAITKLRDVLQADKSMAWKHLRRDVLDPTLADINEKTELRVSCAPERDGRTDLKRGKVEAVMLHVKERGRKHRSMKSQLPDRSKNSKLNNYQSKSQVRRKADLLPSEARHGAE